MPKKDLKAPPLLKACAGLCLAVFFWALNTVIARAVAFEIRPMTLSFYRWFFALIFILPFALFQLKSQWPQVRKHWPYLLLLSIPSVTVYNSFVYIGAQYTTATNISLVVAAMPVVTLMFSWLINHERPDLLKAFGVGVSLCGVLVIISRGSWGQLTRFSFNTGDLLIVISITSWAFYSVMLKKRQIDLSAVLFLAVLIFFGTLCILPFYLWEIMVFNGCDLNTETVSIFIYLGICPSILSYLCWNYGVKIAGASAASIFLYLLPVFTAVTAFIYLGETLAVYHLTGGLLILAGLVLSAFR
jgi:drug/metabolite transporter (DMT)-like permease